MGMYQELAEYLGVSEDACAARFQAIDINRQWRERKSVIQFYQDADYYLYDLTSFEHSPMKAQYRRELTGFIQTRNIRSVLDYGCGIGTELLTAYDAGVHELYGVDVPGAPRDYLMWRMRRRNIPITFIPIHPESTLPGMPLPKVDLAICVAVLEHVEKPREALHLLIASTKFLALRIDPTVGEGQPMHLPENAHWLGRLDAGAADMLNEFGLVRVNTTDPAIYSTPRGRSNA